MKLLLTIALACGIAGPAFAQSWGVEYQVSHTAGSSGGSVGRALAVDREGRLHTVWTEQVGNSYDIYYSHSADGGQTWSAPVDVSVSARPATSGNIAAGPDGALHVAWVDRRSGGNARVNYARSLDSGHSWSTPIDVSGDQGASVNTPILSPDTAGRVHMSWHTGEADAAAPIAVVSYARSTNGGSTFESPKRLSSVTGRHAAWPKFAVDGTSGTVVAIAWRDNRRDPDWDAYVAVSVDGGQSFVERAAQTSASREWDPDIVVDTAGRLHLSYMVPQAGGTQIRYTQSQTLGQSWSTPVTLTDVHSRFPSFVPDWARGVLWLFWKDERDAAADSVARYSLDGGTTWSALEWITSNGSVSVKFPSPAVGPDGRTHVSWSDDRYGAEREAIFIKSRISAPTSPAGLPGAPGNLRATVSGRNVTLAWSAATGSVTTYVIEAGTAPGAANAGTFAVGAVTGCTAGGVPPGVYYARVRAMGVADMGVPSNEIIVTVS